MHRIRSLTSFLLVLPLLGAVALGCNTGTEEPAAPEAETDSSATGQRGAAEDAATETDSAGMSSIATDIDPTRFPTSLPEGITAEVPRNYPADLPIYPNAAPSQGKGVDHEGLALAAVQLLTNDSPAEAFEFYKRELASKGWTIEKAEDMGKNSAISVNRDGCKATILITPGQDGGADIYTVTECGDDA